MKVVNAEGSMGGARSFFDLDRWAAHDVFRFLRPDQIAVLKDASSVFSVRAGDTIYRQQMKVGHIYSVLKGKVALWSIEQDGLGVLISEVGPGEMFGSCLSSDLTTYSLTARCSQDSEILKINADALKRLMDAEPRTGYAIQSRISAIYFNRYIATMRRLRGIAATLPMESVPGEIADHAVIGSQSRPPQVVPQR